MDKETYIALEVIMEDIAKGRDLHRAEWTKLNDWLYENRKNYYPKNN